MATTEELRQEHWFTQTIDNLKRGVAETMIQSRNEMGKPFNVNPSYVIAIVGDLFCDDLEVIRTPLDVMDATIQMAIDAPTVRLLINDDGSINTITWPEEFDTLKTVRRNYNSADGLPDWVQAKLAVLMLLDPVEPNKKEVLGVGRRISENIYWVYPDGFNTREESKDQGT